jgi:hypothetical protein
MKNKNKLLISDTFEIENPQKPNIIYFLCNTKPELTEAGHLRVHLDKDTICLRFDPVQLQAGVETVKIEDPRLIKIWGKQLFRIALRAKDPKSKGNYTYTISKKQSF